FRVNATAEDYQVEEGDLAVAADGSGNFVVAREGYAVGGLFHTVNFQRFDDDGDPAVLETPVDDDGGLAVHVAQAPDGTFMIVWDDGPVVARLFAADGSPVTAEFEVSGPGYAGQPKISASDSSFVVVWNGSSSMYGQRFDLAGNELS